MFKHNKEGLLEKTFIVIFVFIFVLLLWFHHLDLARYREVQKEVGSRLTDAGFTYIEYFNYYHNGDVDVCMIEPHQIHVHSRHSSKSYYFYSLEEEYTADDVMNVIAIMSSDEM